MEGVNVGDTAIEWADKTWNPIRARNRESGKVGWWCSKIAPGCAHCYAERMNLHLGNGIRYAEDQADNVELFLDEKTLKEPLKWKGRCRVFPCSMTDLFHPRVPHDMTQAMFDVMGMAEKHTFLCLTKRPERIYPVLYGEEGKWFYGSGDYLSNVILMTSVSNQADADRNIPALLSVGNVGKGWKFGVSCEPALGPVDLEHLQLNGEVEIDALRGTHGVWRPHGGRNQKLDWGIFGGESGPGARPCNIEWARSFVRQFKAAGVACFFKQAGSNPMLDNKRILLKDRKGGNLSELPSDLNVREFPDAIQGFC